MCSLKSVVIYLLSLILLPAFLLAGGHGLHKAAIKGDIDMVKKVLTKKPGLLNARNDVGQTPLHVAIQKKQKDVVAFLLKKGADVNLSSKKNKRSPLHYAASAGDIDIIKMLLKMGADVNSREIDNESPLYYASYHGKLDIIKLLLKKGATVKGEYTKINTSPLGYAMRGNHLDTAKLLIKHGADVSQNSGDGWTLLHDAAWRGSKETISFLVDEGIPADSKNKFGRTPLQNAAMMGNVDAAMVLINKGADVNSKSERGGTPLLYAVARGHKKMVAVLLKAGAKAEFKRKKDGKSLVHLAAGSGYGKITHMLLTKGAKANAKDNAGKTPIQYAAKYAHKKATKVLLANGAKSFKGMKKHFANSPLLKKKIKSGNALVWYLGHSGWAVKTEKHLLIFDYYKPKNRADTPMLANGAVNPEEIKGLNTVVFSSHVHGDHYMPEIFDWRKTDANIKYVMGFKPKDKDGYTYVAPRETKKVDGMEITSIKSNDSGGAFFVKVDGMTIFHPGDHANRQKDFSGTFKAEIDFLAAKNLKADLMFQPVNGCGFGDIEAVKKGIYYTVKKLSPQVLFPMHGGGNEHKYQEFAKEAVDKGLKTPIFTASNSGDRFYFRHGNVQTAALHTSSTVKHKKCKKGAKKSSSTCNATK